MDREAGDLRIESNNYYVCEKKKFLRYAIMSEDDKNACFEFAYNMSYAKKGEHRASRSGGSLKRTLGQIFINTYQGKMAEFALYRFLQSRNIDVERPDTSEYKLGKWDSFDIDCQGKHISVKSTKWYGELLLLETKDWSDNAEYIPNIGSGSSKYDYTVLVRFDPDGEELMRKNGLLFIKDEAVPTNIEELLRKHILEKKWAYDFPGFIYHSELLRLIQERRIIPKDAMLNGKTEMDAENYYFQTGNMHAIIELYTRAVSEVEDNRTPLLLIRRCPKCGNELVLRRGYNWFWGCKGFTGNPSCKYREPMEMAR